MTLEPHTQQAPKFESVASPYPKSAHLRLDAIRPVSR